MLGTTHEAAGGLVGVAVETATRAVAADVRPEDYDAVDGVREHRAAW